VSSALPRRIVLVVSVLAASGCGPPCEGVLPRNPERRAAAVAKLALSRDGSDLSVLLVAGEDPSALVRKAAAGAFAVRGGSAAVEALGILVADPDPEVVAVAARALTALPCNRGVTETLIEAYPRGGSLARAEIAAALGVLGGSLREAVELEARRIWETNVLAFERGTPTERVGAAEEIGRSGRAEAVRLLSSRIECARAQDERVAAAAARALGETGDPAARPRLEALLEKAGDAQLREAAAEGLGLLGDPAAADSLARAGARGPTRLAMSAAEALARLPQAPEVAMALCQFALHARDPALVARASAQVRARECKCPTRSLFARLSGRGEEALAALAALGELGLPASLTKTDVAAVERLLASPDSALRTAAIRVLGRLKAWKTMSAIERLARQAAERLARTRAGKSMRVGENEAEHELASAVVALSRLRDERVPMLAAPLLADPSGVVRAGAVEALGGCGRAELSRVAQALQDGDVGVRTTAAEALGQIGPAAVPVLALASKAVSIDSDSATALARALGETGSPDAVPALVALSRGPGIAAAATALGRIGTKDALDALLAILARPEPGGRLETMDALASLGVAEAAPAMATDITSDRPGMRAAAAQALGRISAWRDPRLEALRSDYYGFVRRAAVEALGKQPSKRTDRRRVVVR